VQVHPARQDRARRHDVRRRRDGPAIRGATAVRSIGMLQRLLAIGAPHLHPLPGRGKHETRKETLNTRLQTPKL